MPFAPTDISGCKLWLHADGTLWQDSARTVTATTDGDPVGAADDGSGSGNHALQATSGARPTLKLSLLNGKPVLRFDGDDDVLITPSFTAQTLFLVIVPKSNKLVDSAWGQSGVDTSNIRRAVSSATNWRGVSGDTNANDFSDGGSFFVDSVATDAASDGDWHYLSALASSPLVMSWAIGGQTAYGTGVGGRYLACDIAEVIVYDSALGSTDRASVEAYLTAKYFGGGSPDVTLALTGLAATSSAGTLGVSHSQALTGQAATASAGSLTPSRSIALAGQAATASAGTLTPSRALALTGQAVAASSGTLTPSTTIGLVGQQVTASAGFLTVPGDVTLALTGLSATASAGTLGVGVSKALSGQAATSAAGTLGAALALALSGQQVSASAGTLTASGGSTVRGAIRGTAGGSRQVAGSGGGRGSVQGSPGGLN